MITLTKMKYFCDVIDSGSFTQAGKINHVSQTSITQQIHEIEKELGYTLIDRRVTPVKANKVGQIFYLEAKKVLSQYDIFENNIKQYIDHQSLKLTIGYTSLTDLRELEKIMTKLDYQNIDIVKVDVGQAAEELKNKQYDLVISFQSEFADDPQIESIPIASGKFIACVNSKHPLAHKKATMVEVYHYPLIMLKRKIIGKSYDLMAKETRNLGLKLNVVQECNDVSTELFLIKHNNYVGFLPDQYPINDEDICKVEVVDTPHKYVISLAMLRNNDDIKTIDFFRKAK
ncbi:LysR family transcriptional regulator [Lactobacillus gallinarum]|uniref:HTH lysR-type domain-containing protein n=1 Tax=Lactobacillus gallinarum DSM 10532 = JCM 2011 TaxID=1423748 RepID=A0A0R1NW00_9LACO|nr:LysR family transcriptional regulator [Lactobacillus gallinarum]KRL21754.1 hypothetical protein FC37_GL001242 [Lactobacillus gallinarum DSM 10532 = JCM 2011]